MAERQTVVVGVDPSAGALAALEWAAEFADVTASGLRAVTAWSYPATAALPGGPSLRSPEEMDAETRTRTTEALAAALGRAVDDREIVVDRGSAARALLGSIGPTTSAVVVGKRGLGSIEGRLLGSVSRRVAELSPVPVVVVPTERVPADGPIVVGVDGSESARAARDWAIDVARAMRCGVVVVHGVSGLPAELPPSAIDRFIEQATAMVNEHAEVVRAAGVDVSIVVEVVDPRPLLRSVGDERAARMVVVGSTGEGPTAGLLIGSVVNHVIQQSERPVVVVNHR